MNSCFESAASHRKINIPCSARDPPVVELAKGKLIYVAKNISSRVVHEVPADLRKALASDPQVLAAWEDITPLVTQRMDMLD
jgi:hypothetical protein